jgi:hypothetical protein
MGLISNRLYKVSPGNRNKAAGIIIVGGTGATLRGSNEIPSAFANMVDLNGGLLAAGSFTSFDLLPEYILVTGADAISIQVFGVSLEDTGIDIVA